MHASTFPSPPNKCSSGWQPASLPAGAAEVSAGACIGARRLAGRHNRYPTLTTSNRANYYPGVARVRCLWRPGWRHAQQSSNKPRAEARLAQTPLPLARGLPCDRSVSPRRLREAQTPFPKRLDFSVAPLAVDGGKEGVHTGQVYAVCRAKPHHHVSMGPPLMGSCEPPSIRRR